MEESDEDPISVTQNASGRSINKGLFRDMQAIIAKYDKAFPESDILDLHDLAVSQNKGFLSKLPNRKNVWLDEDTRYEKDALSSTALDDFMEDVIAEETKLAEEEEWEDLLDDQDISSVENASIVSGAVCSREHSTEQLDQGIDEQSGAVIEQSTEELSILDQEIGRTYQPSTSQRVCDKDRQLLLQKLNLNDKKPLQCRHSDDVVENSLSERDSHFTVIMDECSDSDVGEGSMDPDRGMYMDGVKQILRSPGTSSAISHVVRAKSPRRALLYPQERCHSADETVILPSAFSCLFDDANDKWSVDLFANRSESVILETGNIPESTRCDLEKDRIPHSDIDGSSLIERTSMYKMRQNESYMVRSNSQPEGIHEKYSELDKMERVRCWLLGKRKRESASDYYTDLSSPHKSSRVIYRDMKDQSRVLSQSSIHRGSNEVHTFTTCGASSNLLSPVHSVLRSSPRRINDAMPGSPLQETLMRHRAPDSPSSRMLIESWKQQLNINSTDSPSCHSPLRIPTTPKSKSQVNQLTSLRGSGLIHAQNSHSEHGNLSSVTPKRSANVGESDSFKSKTFIINRAEEWFCRKAVDDVSVALTGNDTNHCDNSTEMSYPNKTITHSQLVSDGKQPSSSDIERKQTKGNHGGDLISLPKLSETYLIEESHKVKSSTILNTPKSSQSTKIRRNAYKPTLASAQQEIKRQIFTPSIRSSGTGGKKTSTNEAGYRGDSIKDNDCLPESFKPQHNSTMIPKHQDHASHQAQTPSTDREDKTAIVKSTDQSQKLNKKRTKRTRKHPLDFESTHQQRDKEGSCSDKENHRTVVNSFCKPCGGPRNCQKVFCLRCCHSPVK